MKPRPAIQFGIIGNITSACTHAALLAIIITFTYSQPVLANVAPFTRSGPVGLMVGFVWIIATLIIVVGAFIGRWLARR